MLLNVAGRSPPEPAYLTSCLVELQLDKGPSGSVRAQLRVDDQPQDPTNVVIPSARLDALLDQPATYGEELGKALFDGTALGLQYDEARALLAGEKTPMRFRIVLNDAALDLVRWERVCHRDGNAWVPLASGGHVPFSRFVYGDKIVRSSPLGRRPVRVLLVVASPNDLAEYSLVPIDPVEAQAARDMFSTLGYEVQLSELSSFGATRPTVPNLTGAIATGADIVHVLCHGTPDQDGTILLLEGAKGSCDPVPQTAVVTALRSGAERPKLVFFAACNSALPSGRASLVSLGPALAATGIDAVLAMSDAVTLETAQIFAAQFYKQLFVHGKVDRAANEARALVQSAWDWGVPVLFNLAPDGRLLDFDPGGVREAFLNKGGHVARVAQAKRRDVNAGELSDNVMRAVDELISELEKSHTFLVDDIATKFREAGDDPATFKIEFAKFYNHFKKYYDNQRAWRALNTSCGKVKNLGAQALPFFELTLRDEPETLRDIKKELYALSNVDDDIIRTMNAFLQEMNDKAEEIRHLLNSDLPRAIQLKLDYEEKLSPMFRRSRELLEEIERSATRMQA